MKEIIGRFVGIAAFACAIAAVPCYASDWPEGVPAPEATIDQLMQSYAAGNMAAAQEKYTTPTGRRVIEWLVNQYWFDERLAPFATKKATPVILDHKREGDRFEVVCLFKNDDGGATVSAIFFLQDGVMKFHDLFLVRLKGDKHDIFLSSVVDSPGWAHANFGPENPGNAPGSAAPGFGSAIRESGAVVRDIIATIMSVRTLWLMLPAL
jgi:hypothetical protein